MKQVAEQLEAEKEGLRSRLEEEGRQLRAKGDDVAGQLKDQVSKYDKLSAEMQRTEQKLAETESSLTKSNDQISRLTSELNDSKKAFDTLSLIHI